MKDVATLDWDLIKNNKNLWYQKELNILSILHDPILNQPCKSISRFSKSFQYNEKLWHDHNSLNHKSLTNSNSTWFSLTSQSHMKKSVCLKLFFITVSSTTMYINFHVLISFTIWSGTGYECTIMVHSIRCFSVNYWI